MLCGSCSRLRRVVENIKFLNGGSRLATLETKPTIAPIVRRPLLITGSVIVALVFGEAVARLIYRPPLDIRGEFEGRENYVEQLGPLGFREGALTEEALGEGTTRVLFVGDSFTFGSGVPDPSRRFTDRLESRFNGEQAGSGRDGRFHFFNAGIRGSLPGKWVEAAKELLPLYRPRVVVAVFFLRDGTRLGTSLYFFEPMITDMTARHCGGYRYFYLTRIFCDRRVAREFSDWYLAQFRTAYLGTREERQVWMREQRNLVELQDLATRAGASFHLVIFPLLFGLDDYGFHDVEAEIMRFAAEHGMPVVSLTPGFKGHDERELWVSPRDQHPNARAHDIAAETLAPYLRKVLVEAGASANDP